MKGILLTEIGGWSVSAQKQVASALLLHPNKPIRPKENPSTDLFLGYLRRFKSANLPVPETEYKFDHARRWRFDIAWVGEAVAVEIDGGVYSGGRHVTGTGFTGDCIKLNRATELGWRVLRYTPQMLNRDPKRCIEQVVKLLKGLS